MDMCGDYQFQQQIIFKTLINFIFMKNKILKIAFTAIIAIYASTMHAQQYKATIDNSSYTSTVHVRIYDANNVLLAQTVPSGLAGGASVTLATCAAGIPSYIHIIDNVGCLWAINSLNSVTNCSTCTTCTFTSTSPTFTSVLNTTTSCGPTTYELLLTITP